MKIEIQSNHLYLQCFWLQYNKWRMRKEMTDMLAAAAAFSASIRSLWRQTITCILSQVSLSESQILKASREAA